jgi:hypothetical protein
VFRFKEFESSPENQRKSNRDFKKGETWFNLDFSKIPFALLRRE